jgi:hypothetical protein
LSDLDRLRLFEAFGIELEYMIVDAESLDVRPVSDRVLAAQAGHITSDVEFDDISWSNELTAHVIELKTTEPAPTLDGLRAHFDDHVRRVGTLCGPLGVRLMPTAMHPWMDPHAEMHLWQHEYNAVYEAMDRVFNCRGHGWANLQSMHINLPFDGDDEFGRLHAAVRLILPILPALAASSPIQDARVTGRLDNRLDNYRVHTRKVPSLIGRVIPEPVFGIAEYHELVLGRIYADLAPHDPEGVLHNEFANARGAIARFVRNAIEVRVIDVQECPAADLAIAAATIGALKLLVDETWSGYREQQEWAVDPLADLFERAIGEADRTVIGDEHYLAMFGWTDGPCDAGRLWRHIVEEIAAHGDGSLNEHHPALHVLLEHGPLARRIVAATGDAPSRERLKQVYGRLCECLANGEMFIGEVDDAAADV